MDEENKSKINTDLIEDLDIPIITDEEANEIYLKMTLQS